MRRLPIYILLDTSGSRRGEPIESVKSGLRALMSSLKKDPNALDTVWLCLITFDLEARVLVPLTDINDFAFPNIPVPETSPTNMGEALQMLCNLYRKDIVVSTPEKKGDWLPFVFIMTDGSPSDTKLYKEMSQKIRKYKFAKFVCLAAGPKAKVAPLKMLATEIYSLDTMDSSSFSKFWDWVSTTIKRQSININQSDESLPPPPAEIKIIVKNQSSDSESSKEELPPPPKKIKITPHNRPGIISQYEIAFPSPPEKIEITQNQSFPMNNSPEEEIAPPPNEINFFL